MKTVSFILRRTEIFFIFPVLFYFQTFATTINTQQYKFNANLTYEFIESSNLYDPFMGYLYPQLFTFGYSMVTNPFVVQKAGTNEKLTNVLDDIKSYQFGYNLQLTRFMDHRWSGGVYFSVDQAHKSFDPQTLQVVDKSITTFGDTYFNLKYKFFESDQLIISLKGELGLGTGSRDFYMSDGYSLGGMGIIEYMTAKYRISLNGGLRLAGEAQFENVDYRRRVQTGFGGFYAFSRTLGGTVEVKKDFGFSSVTGNSVSGPGEIHFGVQKKILHEGWTLFGSVGTGALPLLVPDNSNGTDLRVAIGVKYTPGFETPTGAYVSSDKLGLDENSPYQKKFAFKYTEPKARELIAALHDKSKRKPVPLAPPRNNIEKEIREKTEVAKEINKELEKEKEDIALVFSNYINLRQALSGIQKDIAQLSQQNPLNQADQKRSVAQVPSQPAKTPPRKINPSLTPQDQELCRFSESVSSSPPPTVHFNAGQELAGSETPTLNRALGFISQHADKLEYVRIRGSTNVVDPKSGNIRLSQEKVQNVQRYLQSHAPRNATFKAELDNVAEKAGQVRIEYVVRKPAGGSCY